MILDRVTVTGADDNTDPEALLTLAKDFPFVEFGILVSPSNSAVGCPRFPSWRWIERFLQMAEGKSLRLSAHLCGRFVRDAYIGDWSQIVDNFWQHMHLWKRFQLNTHGVHHKKDILAMELAMFARFLKKGNSIILQKDNANDEAQSKLLYLGDSLASGSVDMLFDLSHGAGILPTSWPAPIPSVYCGYAGGLSVANVKEQIDGIRAISSVPADTRFWIDAETHLRSEQGDTDIFDLNKVKAFLEQASPYVAYINKG